MLPISRLIVNRQQPAGGVISLRSQVCNSSKGKTLREQKILYPFGHKELRAFGRPARTEFRHGSCNTAVIRGTLRSEADPAIDDL